MYGGWGVVEESPEISPIAEVGRSESLGEDRV